MLLFNPPYVPSTQAELDSSRGVAKALVGGINGRQIVDRFLPFVPRLLNDFNNNQNFASIFHLFRLLSDNGVFYLVVLKANKIDQLLQLAGSLGLSGISVVWRKCGIETLGILKFSKNHGRQTELH